MEEDASAGRLVVSTLLKDLPADLDLTHYFDGQPKVDDGFAHMLEKHPANNVAGIYGIVMSRYGMAMTTIIDVLATISRAIRKFQCENGISSQLTVMIGEDSHNAPPTIARGVILAQVVMITDLDETVASRLLQWLYAVAEIKPKIIPGYIYEHGGGLAPGGQYCGCVNQLFETWSYIRT